PGTGDHRSSCSAVGAFLSTGLCPGEAAVPPRCTSPLGAPQGTNSGSIPIRLDCTGLPAPQVRPFQVRYTGM
ncbi:hypothetical protein KUO08_26020, partial [Bacteroides thetaiotaomicron]